ncbi:MAG: hypothetical protein ACI4IW_07480 [Oscillospiraceae bacterium]
MAEEKQEFMTYKGRPLVRSKKILYYGDMRDPYVVMLQIANTVESAGTEVAGHVVLQMMSTDPNAAPTELVLKRAERDGLYAALDLASAWLDRQLGEVTD